MTQVTIGLISLLLSIGTLCQQGCQMQTGTGENGFRNIETKSYLLFAKDEEDLKLAATLLDSATAGFIKYFAELPPQITIVVFNHSEEMGKYTANDFKGNRYFLPWLSQRYFLSLFQHALNPSSEQIIVQLGVTAVQEKEKVRVKTVTAIAKFIGVDLQEGDEIILFNTAKINAIATLKSLIENYPVDEKYELTVLRNNKEEILKCKKVQISVDETPPSTKITGDEKRLAALSFSAISHEAGHFFFIEWAKCTNGMRQKQNKEISHYGCPEIPDWMDEMAANLVESESIKSKHRAPILANPSTIIPLDTFLVMNHPLDYREDTTGTTEIKGSSNTMQIQISDNNSDSTNTLKELFYPQSLLFGEFLFDKLGSSVFNELKNAYINHKTFTDYLATQNVLPKNIPSLEQLFLQWLEMKSGK